jgi:hypothetical protein
MGQMRNAYTILVGNQKGRPRRKWEDNTRMDVREIGLKDVDWIHLPLG